MTHRPHLIMYLGNYDVGEREGELTKRIHQFHVLPNYKLVDCGYASKLSGVHKSVAQSKSNLCDAIELRLRKLFVDSLQWTRLS